MRFGSAPRQWIGWFLFGLTVALMGCGGADSADPNSNDDQWNSQTLAESDSGQKIDFGAATINPTSVAAAANQTFVLKYRVGEPLQAGGGLRVTFGESITTHDACPATVDPTASCGQIRATASRPDVSLSVSFRYGDGRQGVRLLHVFVTVDSGELLTGDGIAVVYGAGDGKAYAQEIAQRVEVTVAVMLRPDGPAGEIAWSPTLSVRPLAPAKLVSAIGLTDGVVKLSVVDRFGNLVDWLDAEAVLTLVAENGEETPLGVAAINRGVGERDLPDPPAGYYLIRAELGDYGLTSRVPFAPGRQRVFYGDPHYHTMLSDSYVAIDPIDAYVYAAQTALLDFAVDTDHAECVANNRAFTQYLTRSIPDSWQEMRRLSNLANQLGLTTLVGYETSIWSFQSPRAGHFNVYYRGDNGLLHTWLDRAPGAPGIETPEELWQSLDAEGAEAVTITHHTMRPDGIGSDFAYYDPRYMRVVEIYSEHGCSESADCPRTLYRNGQSEPLGAVRRALGPLGYRMGFVGGSDNHAGHPAGTGIPDPGFLHGHPGGLTALVADELNRDSLWTGLYNRSTYATTGERIYLEFSLNGARMGAELTAPDAIHVEARVVGTAEIIGVELLRYTASQGWTSVAAVEPDSLFWNGAFEDPELSENAVYYLRVLQADGAMAWASPIWVDL